jgi:hypothetical protein
MEDQIKVISPTEARIEIAGIADEYLRAYEEARKQRLIQAPEATVKVSEVLGAAAFLYEKIRNAIDYKDEHLVRRGAIERILRRRLGKAGSSHRGTGEALVRELIWARYLKNDSVPKSRVERIDRVIEKYLFLRRKVFAGGAKNAAFVREWNDWLFSIVSCEVDREFVLFDDVEALVRLMYKWMRQNFAWTDQATSQEEKDIQLYIAIHRALVKSDKAILRYHLFNLYYPHWREAEEGEWRQVAENLFLLREKIEGHLSFAQGVQLYRYVSRHTAPFLVLKDLVSEDPGQAREKLANPERLEQSVREICARRYAEISQKLRRGVVRSIIYIFVTKMFLALLLELPFDLYIAREVRVGPLVANVIFPPFLMFLVGMTIRAPGDDNTEKLFRRISSVVYGDRLQRSVQFSLRPVRQNRTLSVIFASLYIFFFLASFGVIITLLHRLGFNLASGALFIFFLSVVTFFGFRIRRTARELSVGAEREGLISHLMNVLSLPFLNAGAWLSTGLSRVNVFTYVMDFLIEAPFKSIIEVVEQWTSFMRQKREEIIETPTP